MNSKLTNIIQAEPRTTQQTKDATWRGNKTKVLFTNTPGQHNTCLGLENIMCLLKIPASVTAKKTIKGWKSFQLLLKSSGGFHAYRITAVPSRSHQLSHVGKTCKTLYSGDGAAQIHRELFLLQTSLDHVFRQLIYFWFRLFCPKLLEVMKTYISGDSVCRYITVLGESDTTRRLLKLKKKN